MCPPAVLCPELLEFLYSRPIQGTFMYRPREHATPYDVDECHRIHEWPYIPDTKLPEPWSCDWSRSVGGIEWYDVEQEIALKHTGQS